MYYSKKKNIPKNTSKLISNIQEIENKLFLASYYKQLFADIECKIIRLKPVF